MTQAPLVLFVPHHWHSWHRAAEQEALHFSALTWSGSATPAATACRASASKATATSFGCGASARGTTGWSVTSEKNAVSIDGLPALD